MFGWAIAAETSGQAEAADLELDWPTTCVELNDIVEGHLGNQGNVAIYQNTFGDQAEAACQNDHRNDVRSVFAWAIGTSGAAPPAESVHRFVAVSSGAYHTCALREGGEPVCWGADASKSQGVYSPDRNYGQASPPEGERLAAISSGALHTCGLRQDGTAVCWGQNEFGQSSPPDGERFVEISSGSVHTCALRVDGRAVCWGAGSPAREGEADPYYDRNQASPPAGERFVAITSGGDHSCGLREDGRAVCWSRKPYWEGFVTASQGPRLIALDSIGGHMCGLYEDGRAVCWAGDRSDEVNPGQSPPRSRRFVAITAGGRHGCGIQENGTIACWGDETSPWGEKFLSVSAGGQHTCALRYDHTIECWGYNNYGSVNGARAGDSQGARHAVCCHKRWLGAHMRALARRRSRLLATLGNVLVTVSG